MLFARTLTFPTTFLPLSEREIELICDVHDSKAVVSDLDGLRDRIAHLVDIRRGAFVRLSTRSAKDWALRAERTSAIFEQQREAVRAADPAVDSDVADVIAIIRSMSFALRVHSADEVVEILTHSERSYQDCFRWQLSCGEGMHLVVRQWEEIQPELEPKGFCVSSEADLFVAILQSLLQPAPGAAGRRHSARSTGRIRADETAAAIGLFMSSIWFTFPLCARVAWLS